VKTVFVSAILKEGADAIREEQTQVVDDWDLFESGKLKESLQGHFSIANIEGGAKLSMRYLAYARFLDIHRKGTSRAKRNAYHLYNRINFGFLYGQMMPTIRFGFSEEIKNKIANSIANTAPGTSFYKIRDNQINAINEIYGRNMAAIMSKKYRQGYY
jgi:hypothetical protein